MKYFGTDGIRGTYGDLEISESFFYALGRALAELVDQQYKNKFVVVGGDTRASTASLKEAFLKGATEGGLQCEDMTVLPTPALAYCVLAKNAQFGVMITASHNPYYDNGIKFFNSYAQKVDDETQLALEEKLEKYLDKSVKPCAKKFEPCEIPVGNPSALGYIEKMVSLFPANMLSGLKIAIDMANGATSKVSSEVFRRYGAEVFEKSCQPNGMNINEGVGSQHPESLEAFCKEVGADVGFAHDGDGDRVIVVDENASVLEGEEVLGLIALDAKARGILPKPAIVTTLQSNMGLDDALAKEGIEVLRSGIGDRLVMRMMQENGLNVGGENSGHYIFSEISPCGDGLAAALSVLSVLASSGKKLSVLRNCVSLYPVQSKGVKVAKKIPIEQTPTLSKVIAECEQALNGCGRLLVRYSGTEKKIRLLVEGKDADLINECMAKLEKSVENDLQ